MRDKDKLTRREFLRLTAGAGIGLTCLPLLGEYALGAAAGGKTPVAFVTSSVPLSKKEPERIRLLLDEAIRFVAGVKDPAVFWKATFKPDDRVAIKINAAGGKIHNLGPSVADAIAFSLAKHAGVKPDNIVVFDRTNAEMRLAGYKLNWKSGRVQYYGTDQAGGYCGLPVKSGSVTTRFSKIVDECDALINMPVLKTHRGVGVSICLKNHYGSIDNPQDLHGHECDPYIADLNASDMIKKKTRLVVCDATRPLFDGGPVPMQKDVCVMDALLVGLDPVAVDACGLRILEKYRKDNGIVPVKIEPGSIHIRTAAKIGIGADDPAKINFKEITV